MVDVFISYPQRERALMLPIKQRLEALGLILFVDVEGRLDGEATFPEALDKGVRASKAVLGCWSPWALGRPWVQTECAIGKDENKLVAVERVALTTADVPALFYLVDRKPLSDFDGTAPHEGWAMTLSALATKLKLWVEKRPGHPEVLAAREKIVVLEKAAAAERSALDKRQQSRDAGVTPPPAVASDAAERAWVAIERSLDVAHYRRFERTFENDPAAFVRVIEAEARAKALERWAATDRQDADAIAETLRTGLFPALQDVAERSLSTAEEAARQHEAARARAAAEELQSTAPKPAGGGFMHLAMAKAQQKIMASERAAADERQGATPKPGGSGFMRSALLKAAAVADGILVANTLPWIIDGRIKVDAATFWPHESEAAQAGWLKPGAGKIERFKDLDIGPEMVVMPGNPAFSIGRFAVSFAEWDAAQAHPEWKNHAKIEPRNANDAGWGRGKRPVIDVSSDDAAAYCKWLSAITSKTYRLPSNAEWELACRAGTTTTFWWGNKISTSQANYNVHLYGPRRGYITAEVDCYQPNPWGLYQVHGNVLEWCSSKRSESDPYRILRGGSWDPDPELLLHSFDYVEAKRDLRIHHTDKVLGFRVARTLPQELLRL